jgi:hypothetical protein
MWESPPECLYYLLQQHLPPHDQQGSLGRILTSRSVVWSPPKNFQTKSSYETQTRSQRHLDNQIQHTLKACLPQMMVCRSAVPSGCGSSIYGSRSLALLTTIWSSATRVASSGEPSGNPYRKVPVTFTSHSGNSYRRSHIYNGHTNGDYDENLRSLDLADGQSE